MSKRKTRKTIDTEFITEESAQKKSLKNIGVSRPGAQPAANGWSAWGDEEPAAEATAVEQEQEAAPVPQAEQPKQNKKTFKNVMSQAMPERPNLSEAPLAKIEFAPVVEQEPIVEETPAVEELPIVECEVIATHIEVSLPAQEQPVPESKPPRAVAKTLLEMEIPIHVQEAVIAAAQEPVTEDAPARVVAPTLLEMQIPVLPAEEKTDRERSRRDAGAPGFVHSNLDENSNRAKDEQFDAGSAGVPPASESKRTVAPTMLEMQIPVMPVQPAAEPVIEPVAEPVAETRKRTVAPTLLEMKIPVLQPEVIEEDIPPALLSPSVETEIPEVVEAELASDIPAELLARRVEVDKPTVPAEPVKEQLPPGIPQELLVPTVEVAKPVIAAAEPIQDEPAKQFFTSIPEVPFADSTAEPRRAQSKTIVQEFNIPKLVAETEQQAQVNQQAEPVKKGTQEFDTAMFYFTGQAERMTYTAELRFRAGFTGGTPSQESLPPPPAPELSWNNVGVQDFDAPREEPRVQQSQYSFNMLDMIDASYKPIQPNHTYAQIRGSSAEVEIDYANGGRLPPPVSRNGLAGGIGIGTRPGAGQFKSHWSKK